MGRGCGGSRDVAGACVQHVASTAVREVGLNKPNFSPMKSTNSPSIAAQFAVAQDDDPYVRKTAAICVAKLYDINPELVEDRGFLDMLRVRRGPGTEACMMHMRSGEGVCVCVGGGAASAHTLGTQRCQWPVVIPTTQGSAINGV